MNISLKKIGVLFLFVVSIFIIQFFLVACSQSVEFTIYFDSNGGSEVSSIKTGGDSVIVIPANPIKEGFEFDGWYWDNNTFNRSFTASSLLDEPISSNMTVYAKWTSSEEEDLGIVSATGFEIDGTNMYIEVPNITTTYSFINLITVSSSATWDLYNDITATNKIASKTINLSIGDNKVYILVSKNDEIMLYTVTVRRLPIYEVSFNTGGGLLVESQSIQEGDFLEKPVTTKQGYTFIRWEDINNNTITFPIKIENDMLIKAKWQANQNTLSFEGNGGVGEMSSVLVETNETISFPKNTFTREGYTFVGWSTSIDGSVDYVDEASYTMGVLTSYTLYAKWGMITYSIVYVMNEYTTNDASNPATYNVTSNISLIAPSVIEGTFIGWFTDEDYTNEIENISNMTGNITLYAKVEINQYTMTFVTNGGTEISPITQDYGTAIHVSTTKEGLYIKAWCSDEGLTTSIDISKMPNANLTVYAKWAQRYEFFTINNMTYVYYGTYPQTVVDDSSLISSLNSLTSTNANGYYEFEGEEYAKVVAHTAETRYYQFINGSTIRSGQTYYFKVEPIKWRVLEEADGTYTLLSEYIIDKQVFYTSSDNRTIGDQTIYANNYEHSTIREWLNNAFYNKAFSTQEKGSILTTLVDNSASTTSSSTKPYFSNNTMDKVYLLSYQEAISSTYGFSASIRSSTRTAITTDYTRAVGAYMNTSTSYYGEGAWWLRSPNIPYSIIAHNVFNDGYLYYSNVYYSYGARPAIKIG